MERVKFVDTKKKILKIIAVFLLVVLSISLVFVIIYSRFGIAGIFQNKFISGIFGLNKQENLLVPTISQTEKDSIISKLGFDPEKELSGEMKSHRKIDFSLTPQGTAFLMNSLIKNKAAMKNLQVATTDNNELELSAIADIDIVCKMVGENKESIESSIGELPDQVPVYATVNAAHGDNNSSITSIKVGQLQIPDSIYTSINGYVDQGLDLFFENALGIDLENLSVKDNVINISGEFPSP